MKKYFSKPMTHERLQDVLLSLGFKRCIWPSRYSEKLGFTLPEAVVYEYPEVPNAMIFLPVLPLDTKLDGAHRDMAVGVVYDFDIYRPKEKLIAMLTAPAEKTAPKPEPKRELTEAAA